MTSIAIAPNAGSVSVASHRPRQPASRLRASARLRSSALPSVALSSSSASGMNIDGGARKNGITISTDDASQHDAAHDERDQARGQAPEEPAQDAAARGRCAAA